MSTTLRPRGAPYVVALGLALALVLTTLGGLVAPADAYSAKTRVKVKVSKKITDGQLTVVTGKIKPKSANRDVQLQERVGKGWVLLTRTRTTAASTYSLASELITGEHTLRVVARAKNARLGTSKRKVVTVVADPNNRGDRIAQGVTLNTGQYLRSPNRRYVLVMQPNGMLTLADRATGAVLWSKGGPGATFAYVQPDGDFVVQAPTGKVFSAGTGGLPDGMLVLQDDGNLLVVADGFTVWNRVEGYIGNMLRSGATLPTGARMMSPNGRYLLGMQADGNLVEYDRVANQIIWTTNTSGAGHVLTMHPDGNLAIFRGSTVVWNAGSFGFAGAEMRVQDDGNVVVSASFANNLSTWSRTTGYIGDLMFPNTYLPIGAIRYSANRRFRLTMQSDGNLVELDGTTPIWSARTSGNNVAVMQTDGNFVIYRIGGAALFNTNTSGTGSLFKVLDDGNVVVYDAMNAVVWSKANNP